MKVEKKEAHHGNFLDWVDPKFWKYAAVGAIKTILTFSLLTLFIDIIKLPFRNYITRSIILVVTFILSYILLKKTKVID